MRRFCIVGTGGRGLSSYIRPIIEDFKGEIEIVGLYDINPLRLKAICNITGVNFPLFDNFEKMLDETKPDGVVVTSKDCSHAEYVVQALKRNISVYSEKPLCTTREQCKAIREAAAKSKGESFVTHNMRFMNDMAEIRKRIVDGELGKVMNITFLETLDRFHGAEYYRRWHRFFSNTGSLMMHKASHHFDLINWFADSRPDTVTGQGGLYFYGKNGPYRSTRCLGCPHKDKCEFYANVFANKLFDQLYHQAEPGDGYFRDGCVYDDRIDIPDTYNATISYENGVKAVYSLVTYAQFSSMLIRIEGTKGAVYYYQKQDTSWTVGHDNVNVKQIDNQIFIQSRDFKVVTNRGYSIEQVPELNAEGGHGGADPALRRMLFIDRDASDPLHRKAPLEAGIQAVLLGVSIMESISKNGIPVKVQQDS